MPKNPFSHPYSDVDGVEADKHIACFDWSATPLGPPDQWSDRLRTAVGQVLVDRAKGSDLNARYGSPADLPFESPLQQVFAQDMTELAAARQIIMEKELRYLDLLLQSPFAVAIFKGYDMVITLPNDAIKAMWGKGQAVEGRPFTEVMPEVQGQGFLEMMRQVYTSGEPFSVTEKPGQVMRNGQLEQAYFNFVLQPLRESDGTISGIACIAQEVTNRALVNRKMEESEARLRHLLMQVPFPVVIYRGPELRVELANAAALEVFGKTWVEIAHQPITSLYPAMGLPEWYAVHEQAYTIGQSVRTTERQLTFLRDGQPYTGWFNAVYEPLRDAGGVVDAHTDISARRLSEEAFRESEQRQRALSESLEQKVRERTRELTEVNEAFEHAEAISLMGNYKWDLERNTITWSKNRYAIYGVTPATFTPALESIMSFTHPEDIDKMTANVLQAF